MKYSNGICIIIIVISACTIEGQGDPNTKISGSYHWEKNPGRVVHGEHQVVAIGNELEMKELQKNMGGIIVPSGQKEKQSVRTTSKVSSENKLKTNRLQNKAAWDADQKSKEGVESFINSLTEKVTKRSSQNNDQWIAPASSWQYDVAFGDNVTLNDQINVTSVPEVPPSLIFLSETVGKNLMQNDPVDQTIEEIKSIILGSVDIPTDDIVFNELRTDSTDKQSRNGITRTKISNHPSAFNHVSHHAKGPVSRQFTLSGDDSQPNERQHDKNGHNSVQVNLKQIGNEARGTLMATNDIRRQSSLFQKYVGHLERGNGPHHKKQHVTKVTPGKISNVIIPNIQPVAHNTKQSLARTQPVSQRQWATTMNLFARLFSSMASNMVIDEISDASYLGERESRNYDMWSIPTFVFDSDSSEDNNENGFWDTNYNAESTTWSLPMSQTDSSGVMGHGNGKVNQTTWMKSTSPYINDNNGFNMNSPSNFNQWLNNMNFDNWGRSYMPSDKPRDNSLTTENRSLYPWNSLNYFLLSDS